MELERNLVVPDCGAKVTKIIELSNKIVTKYLDKITFAGNMGQKYQNAETIYKVLL